MSVIRSAATTETKAVREGYGEALVELGRLRPDVVLLDADVSSSTRSALFASAFPDRFYNVGIAEGNMMAMAAGMASAGLMPFVNTFAVFATLRAGDPLRTQVALARRNVKIGAAYAGLSDSYDGATHQSVEDLAIARAIPNLAVVSVADAFEAGQAVQAAAEYDGPVYLRLSRAAIPVLFDATHPFQIGRAVPLRSGSDVTLIATGYMVHKSLDVADLLEAMGVSAEVIEVHTLKPLDEEAVVEAASRTGAVVTVEEHSVYGGLGSAVAEVLGRRHPVPMEIVGIPDVFGESGAYEEILESRGLSTDAILQRTLGLLRRVGR